MLSRMPSPDVYRNQGYADYHRVSRLFSLKIFSTLTLLTSQNIVQVLVSRSVRLCLCGAGLTHAQHPVSVTTLVECGYVSWSTVTAGYDRLHVPPIL